MRMLDFYRYGLGGFVALAMLAGCGGAWSSSTPATAVGSQPTPLHRGTDDIYVDAAIGFSSSEILGYRIKSDRPTLLCRVKNVTYADNIAVDGKGDVWPGVRRCLHQGELRLPRAPTAAVGHR